MAGRKEEKSEHQDRKVGVYICHCGGNISDHVDVQAVCEKAQSLPGVSVARTEMFMCSDPGQELIMEDLKSGVVDPYPFEITRPNADTLDAVSYKEMKECGGTFGSNTVGSCSGEALMRAMTNSLDTIFGKLLEAVDAMDPNTYVIFISDNGTPMYGRANLDFIDNMYITRKGRGKGTAYESGALVPMIIRGPKIAANTQNNAYAHVMDLFSTILELARLTPPKNVSNSDGTGTVPVDAVSLAPILFNKAKASRDPNKGYILNENKNLMTGGTRWVGAQNATYKVVCIDSLNNCTFYNLADDPLEEYPLPKPESCADYANGKWTPKDPQWHYCRLTDVVAKDSFLSVDKK